MRSLCVAISPEGRPTARLQLRRLCHAVSPCVEGIQYTLFNVVFRASWVHQRIFLTFFALFIPKNINTVWKLHRLQSPQHGAFLSSPGRLFGTRETMWVRANSSRSAPSSCPGGIYGSPLTRQRCTVLMGGTRRPPVQARVGHARSTGWPASLAAPEPSDRSFGSLRLPSNCQVLSTPSFCWISGVAGC